MVYTEYVQVPAHIDRHDFYVEEYACHACEDGTEASLHCPDKPHMVVIAAKLPKERRHPLTKGSKASLSIVALLFYD